MIGYKLEESQEEKDLGVLVSYSLKGGPQCSQVFLKANHMLGVLNMSIVKKSPNIMLHFYKSLVRPHVEYWLPQYIEYKHTLEHIQRRFTRLIPGMKQLSYTEQLDKLKLWTLEEQQNCLGLLEVFKMAKNLSSTPLTKYFELNTCNRTCGHLYRLVKHDCNSDICRQFFSERVINCWSSLDQDTLSSKTVND